MNSDCSRIFALLSEYLDRELPVGDCAELERHIQSCEPCVAFVESLKKSVALGKEWAPSPSVPPLDRDVRRSLEEAYDRMRAERGES